MMYLKFRDRNPSLTSRKRNSAGSGITKGDMEMTDVDGWCANVGARVGASG
jgi:hypothetical protein